MPDSRSHRGAHPRDASDFAASHVPALVAAVTELSFLLDRAYSPEASLKLVGDHHQLRARARMAVLRAACGEQARTRRLAQRVDSGALRGEPVILDGFNCLICVEAMLSGAPVFRGRDSALRDLSSVHGTYRTVQETERAIDLMLGTLEICGIGSLRVLLDRPVGNSGRTRSAFLARAGDAALPIEVELRDDVDRELTRAQAIVASSDSWVIERAARWFDLPALVAERHDLAPWLIDFYEAPEGGRR